MPDRTARDPAVHDYMGRDRPGLNHPKNDDDLLARLPLTITKSVTQKKRDERLSLFHKDQFLLGLSSKIAEKLGISEGTLLDASTLASIRYEEERSEAVTLGYKLLAIRDHAVAEFEHKLRKKGIRRDIVDACSEAFQKSDLLNDDRFARQFVSSKSTLSQWGPVKLIMELKKRGISETQARSALADTFQKEDVEESCIALIQKRETHFKREKDPVKRKQKVFRYLSSKGYTMDVIYRSAERIEWLP